MTYQGNERSALDAKRCDACGALFDTAEELALHRSRAHKARADGVVTCPQCRVSFESRLDFEAHLQLAHTGSRRA